MGDIYTWMVIYNHSIDQTKKQYYPVFTIIIGLSLVVMLLLALNCCFARVQLCSFYTLDDSLIKMATIIYYAADSLPKRHTSSKQGGRHHQHHRFDGDCLGTNKAIHRLFNHEVCQHTGGTSRCGQPNTLRVMTTSMLFSSLGHYDTLQIHQSWPLICQESALLAEQERHQREERGRSAGQLPILPPPEV